MVRSATRRLALLGGPCVSRSPRPPHRPRWPPRPSRPHPPRSCPPGTAASTSIATASSPPRRAGCGAPPPASRSCATSSSATTTTRRRASAATSTGCARRTTTSCPESAGVDPQGWTAGLRHFVDDRYRLVASRSFGAGLKSAAANLRRTGLPVALTVSPRQPRLDPDRLRGDRRPAADRRLRRHERPRGRAALRAPEQERLRHASGHETQHRGAAPFFTPWRYAPMAMKWDGRYVSIQPVAKDHEPPVAWAARAARFVVDLEAIRARSG